MSLRSRPLSPLRPFTLHRKGRSNESVTLPTNERPLRELALRPEARSSFFMRLSFFSLIVKSVYVFPPSLPRNRFFRLERFFPSYLDNREPCFCRRAGSVFPLSLPLFLPLRSGLLICLIVRCRPTKFLPFNSFLSSRFQKRTVRPFISRLPCVSGTPPPPLSRQCEGGKLSLLLP